MALQIIFSPRWANGGRSRPGGVPGTETNRGLLDWRGHPKPAYRALKRG